MKLTLARRTTDPSVTVGLIEAYPAITLLGGSVEAMSAAKQLYSKTLDLRDLSGRVTWEGTSTADPAYQKANDAVTAVYEKFINVPREDSRTFSGPDLRICTSVTTGFYLPNRLRQKPLERSSSSSSCEGYSQTGHPSGKSLL